MTDIEIRKMTEGDLPAVGVLAAGLVRQHHQFDPARFMLVEPIEDGYRWWFAKELKREEVVLQVATIAGEVVGYVYGTVEERDWAKLLDAHGAVHDVFVAEKFRKNGIARRLMGSAVQTLRAQGVKNVVLYSAAQNEGAQALFKSMGFRTSMLEMTLSE